MMACFAEGNDPGWKHCGSAVLERLTQGSIRRGEKANIVGTDVW